MPWKEGDIVAGRFRLEALIGYGGMGAVYRARHLGLDKDVAVKLFLPEASQDGDFGPRFEREAKVASRLQHDNAVDVFDFGQYGSTLYLVMELLHGRTLESLLSESGAFELDRALHTAFQLADVLAVAHELGLVHRDLKPANIILEERPDGLDRPVIVDFGLAFIQNDDEKLARMTQEGVVSGTPQFLSPEQASGTREIGPPSDIYSLGCVLHELVAGEPVFAGRTTVKLLNSHLFVPPTSLRVRFPDLEIPAALDALIISMLAKTPEERPTALEVRDWIATMMERGDTRERGRPARLLDIRSRRAVTEQSPTRAPSLETPKVTARGRVAVIGDIAPSWLISLKATGYACGPWEGPDDGTVAIFAPWIEVDDVESLKESGLPLICAADATNLDRSTRLLALGVSDVVTVPIEPSELVRKVERAIRRDRRRS